MRRNAAGPLRGLLAGLLLLATGAGSAGAQRTLRSLGSDVGHGVGDMLYVLSAPARGDRRDWITAAEAGALVLAIGAADRDIHRWIVQHPSSAVMEGIRPFREGQDVPLVDLGSGYRILPLAGAVYVVGFLADSRTLRDVGLGCASAQQAQSLVHTLVQYAVQRERPLTSGGDPYDITWGSGPWERHAFYGGHVANIMSCVSYWNERFHMGAVEPLLYVLAAGIGLGRMADQRHWASDVAVGALVGYATGSTIGRRARKRAEGEGGAPDRTGLLDHAVIGGGAGGMTVGWRIEF